jgi:DNA-binding beta-propeller fold protein YncE
MHQHPLRTVAPVHSAMRTALVALALVLVVAAAGAFCAQPAAAASLPPYLQTYQYIGQFGGPGNGNGQFDFLNQINFGPNGDLYVADTHNARIQELTTDGTWVSTIGVASPPDWGGGSVGFDQPQGIAVSADHVWAVDYSGGLAWFGLNGTWEGMSLGPDAPVDTFGLPQGAGVDLLGNVYVADDAGSYRVIKYDSAGAFVCRITTADPMFGTGVAVDAAGKVYVADSSGFVRRFSPTSVAATAYALSATWSAGGILSSPASIALDPAGNVYVGDTVLSQVVKLSPSGKLLARWGSLGAGNEQFTYLLGVAVDPATSTVYAADRDADRIQKFQVLDLGPKTYAAANLVVKKGKAVTFKYGVAEDVSAKATAWVKIKKGTTIKKTISLGAVKCGSWLTKKWTCTLAKGSYRWSVYATDQGGHTQVLVGSKSLKVK